MVENMIPLEIHYIWFGGKKTPVVKEAIRTWHKYAPEFKIIEWNEKNLPNYENEFYRKALANMDYAFASDYARLRILYDYGGIYMDTDMYLLANPQKIIKNRQLVFGIQDEKVIFSAGFIAATKKQAFLERAIEAYENLEYKSGNKIPNTELLSPLVYKMYNFDHSEKTQFRCNNQVVAYGPNILLQPSFRAIAMHIGEKAWSTHSRHDQLRIKMRKHIKNRFEAGSFNIANNIFRRII